jgi:hypothetical protein
MSDDATVTASQRYLATAKGIVGKHYPEGGTPSGLLTDIYKAVRNAEHFGFADCLRYFECPHCTPDEHQPHEGSVQ